MKNAKMSFWEHIDALRSMLLRCVIIITILAVIAFSFCQYIVEFLERPIIKVLPKEVRSLYFTGISDKFFVYLKASLLISITLSLPYLLFEFWRFISPALYDKERKIVLPFIFCGVLAFITGLSFCYFVVLPFGYKFLIEFGGSNDIPIITIKEYFNLTFSLLLIVGILFELPVVMGLLAKIGIITPKLLVSYRRHAFLLIVLLSAVITPTTDILNMFIVMVPLIILYELGVFFVKFINAKKLDY